MPVYGPSAAPAREAAAFVAPRLMFLMRETVEKELTSYWHVKNAEKVLKDLYVTLYGHTQPIEGYNYMTYDFNRLKYMIVGLLMAKLPNEDFEKTSPSGLTYSGKRINPVNFNFSHQDLEDWLFEIFFVPIMEDY